MKGFIVNKDEVLPRADEVETYPVIKKVRKMVTYLIIGRVKDSDENPWIEFETASQEIAKKKCDELFARNSNTNKIFKIETRTLFNDEIDEFNKSQKNTDWIEKVNNDINQEQVK